MKIRLKFVLYVSLTLISAFLLTGATYQFSQINITPVLACDGTKRNCEESLLYQGPIKLVGYLKLKHSLSKKQYKMICLDSPGGSVFAGKKIIQTIVDNEIDTCVAQKYFDQKNKRQLDAYNNGITQCSSMCLPIILSGRNRIEKGIVLLQAHRFGRPNLCKVNELFRFTKNIPGLKAEFSDIDAHKKALNSIKVIRPKVPNEWLQLISLSNSIPHCQGQYMITKEDKTNLKIFTIQKQNNGKGTQT